MQDFSHASGDTVSRPGMANKFNLQYTIRGVQTQSLDIALQPKQVITTSPGAMRSMTSNVKMSTGAGSLGKFFKRAFAGESGMMVSFELESGDHGTLSLAGQMPSTIVPIPLNDPIIGDTLQCRRGAFMASIGDVDIAPVFKLKKGLSMSGPVLQQIKGDGLVFFECGGDVIIRDLQPGEELIVSSGGLLAITGTVKASAIMVKGLKNMLFAGEGLVNTKLVGPGRVFLETLSPQQMAQYLNRQMAGQA